MPTEIISGLWIGNINDSFNTTLLQDNNITIFINCTTNYGFMDKLEGKRIRIPLSSNLDPKTDLVFLRDKKNNILDYIFKNIENHNILIYCYDGLNISPLIVSLFLMEYGKISKDDIRSILRSKNNKIILDIDLSIFS
tara:strand:- start:240 stop:653 length:414 start_codon:yes stop_codon:yes gene_type:complete